MTTPKLIRLAILLPFITIIGCYYPANPPNNNLEILTAKEQVIGGLVVQGGTFLTSTSLEHGLRI